MRPTWSYTPGDAFLLYTDGLSGAENGDAPRMPIERLVELLPKESGSAQALLSGTVENVIPNKNEKVLADDVAALAVRRGENNFLRMTKFSIALSRAKD